MQILRENICEFREFCGKKILRENICEFRVFCGKKICWKIMAMNAYIIDGLRTPIGSFAGTLAPVRADDLGAPQAELYGGGV